MAVSVVDPVVSELRKQGWECRLTGDGENWQAAPPGTGKRSVLFAARPHDLTRIIRDLRQHGFVWPPGANGHTHALARVTSTPFAPRPHPEATVVELAIEPVSEKDLTPSDDEALAFIRLREAKEYEKLAAAELVKANREAEAARERAADARRAYDEALSDLKRARAAFDAAFGEEKV